MPFVYNYDIIYTMKKKKFIAIFIALFTILYFFTPLFSLKKVQAESDDLKNTAETLQNTVVLVTFNEEGDNFFEDFDKTLERMYQTSPYSVMEYIKRQSNGKMIFNTEILSAKDQMIIKSEFPVEYYKPRFKESAEGYEEINPEGYDNRWFDEDGNVAKSGAKGAKPCVDVAYREQNFIREILSKTKIPENYDSDANKDGKCDSFVVITDLNESSNRADILWPHKGTAYTFTESLLNTFCCVGFEEECERIQEKKLANGVLSTYNLISAKEIVSKTLGETSSKIKESEKDLYNVGLLAHESLHVLGLPDYYSYEDTSYESVGEFDVLGTTHVLPQNMLGYLRYKMGWLTYDEILYVNDSGQYTLPLSFAEGKCVAKIVLSNYHETGEYFMAEFRSSSLATQEFVNDCTLSGDGLIIYRVNPSNAYINEKNFKSTTDYGNMYGEDEVFVYRLGAPGKIKKVADPLGESYALLGSGEEIVTMDGTFSLYDNSTFGNADKSKNTQNLTSSLTKPSETIVYYTDGTNSGIVFSNIKINTQDKTVTFNVELPETQGTMPMLGEENVYIEKGLGGVNKLNWISDVKSGRTHVLVVRSTNRLRQMAENGNSGITIEDFHNKKYAHYETLLYKSLPCAEKTYTLPNFDAEVLVFIAIENEKGASAVRYVGCIESTNPSFGDYYKKIIDPLYYVGLIGIIIVFVLIGLAVIQSKKRDDKNRVYRK